ncbi:hypothetical protein MASR1M29_04170 [Cloacibacterium normanense]
MNFKIVEYRNQLKSKNVIINFLMQYLFLPIFLIVLFFIILPVIFIINLFSKEKNEKIIENNYEVKFENEKIKIERKFIEEKDFPDDLDYGEVYDHYLFEFKSNPELQLFKDRYFDYNFFKTENGIFLISYNNEDEGMSLWFIDKNTVDFKELKKIITAEWFFEKENNNIILTTKTNKEEIKIEIKSDVSNLTSEI